jgi:hypothetical protein
MREHQWHRVIEELVGFPGGSGRLGPERRPTEQDENGEDEDTDACDYECADGPKQGESDEESDTDGREPKDGAQDLSDENLIGGEFDSPERAADEFRKRIEREDEREHTEGVHEQRLAKGVLVDDRRENEQPASEKETSEKRSNRCRAENAVLSGRIVFEHGKEAEHRQVRTEGCHLIGNVDERLRIGVKPIQFRAESAYQQRVDGETGELAECLPGNEDRRAAEDGPERIEVGT